MQPKSTRRNKLPDLRQEVERHNFGIIHHVVSSFYEFIDYRTSKEWWLKGKFADELQRANIYELVESWPTWSISLNLKLIRSNSFLNLGNASAFALERNNKHKIMIMYFVGVGSKLCKFVIVSWSTVLRSGIGKKYTRTADVMFWSS